MEKLERYLQFMREAERLKNVLRSARTSTGRHESTAEHTWRLALLALVLADEKPELDLPRVLAMCLVHDLGEAYEGDIPAVAQCDPASKAAAELAAMERLTPLLPAEAAARIRTLWEEYEACATPEARWVKALDKAETILRTDRPELPKPVREAVEISIKYQGYIDRQLRQVEEMKKLEDRRLPDTIDYTAIEGLRLEARQKLSRIRPKNLGQASRVSGVSPADVAVLMVYLKQREGK